MKRTIAKIAAASAAVASIAVGASASTPAVADETVRATVGVNVRSGPGLNQSIIGGLCGGCTVTKIGASSNGWTPVRWGGRSAYIYSQYLTSGSTQSPTSDGSTGTMKTTVWLNERSGPSLNDGVVRVLAPQTTVSLTGRQSNGFAEINDGGALRWVYRAYLSSSGAAPAPNAPSNPGGGGNLPGVTGTKYTTAALNVRSTPGFDNSPLGFVPEGGSVQVTGVTQGAWTQIIWSGAVRWVYTSYLTGTAPSAPSTNSPISDPNYGGSSGLVGLTPNAQKVLVALRSNFPQIATIYGIRPDVAGGDHGAGRALDAMLPNYRSNAALGQQIADYMVNNARALGVRYVIFRQRIFLVEAPQLGWQWMADRGSDTQNHYDHVHTSVY